MIAYDILYYQYSAFQTANSIGPGGLHTLRGESESTGVKGVPDPVPIEREGDVEKGAAVQYILSTPRAGEQTIVVDPDGVATAPGALNEAGNQHQNGSPDYVAGDDAPQQAGAGGPAPGVVQWVWA